MVRVRQMLADLIFNEAQILANVNLTIERIIEYARAVGVPEGTNKVVNVLTKADNNCKTCDQLGGGGSPIGGCFDSCERRRQG